jgi:hypothetical protein
MPPPPRKRLRAETGSAVADSDNSNNHHSAPKQRISHACDRCRSRRAKCDGSQPTCVTCAAAHVTCTYGTHTKKRGLPTGYVRLLELLWALVFDSIPGAEDVTLQLLCSASVVAGDTGVVLLCHYKGSIENNEKLLTQDNWASSKVRGAIDARVLKIDAAAGNGSGNESTRRVICEGIPLPTDHRIRPWTAMSCNAQISQSEFCACSNTVGRSSPTSAQAELPNDAWAQIGIYLNYSYCWLPVVPKHDIVRLLSKRQDCLPCTASEMALIWSCLAMSSSLKAEPDRNLVAVYHSAAMKELDNDSEKTHAYHVASILILGLSKMELHQWKDAYLLIGRAARLVHYMYNTTLRSNAMLSRVYLGTFILDTLLSCYLGISTLLSDQLILPVLSVYEADGPEEWDVESWNRNGTGELQCPVRVMSVFGQLARLVVVLNMSTAPGIRTVSVVDKLSEWLDQLPKHCFLKERSGPLTPPLANLDMMYWAVRTYISDSLPVGPHTETRPIAEYNRMFGTHASKSMLHICQKLSADSTHKSGHEQDERSADVARDDTVTDTGTVPVLSFPVVEQICSDFEGTQHSIDGSVTYVHGSLQSQPLTRPRRSPAAFATEQPYPPFDGALCQDQDDAQTMQTMLDDILAQEAGNEPFFSSYMQDLGFFDEDVPLQNGPG